MSYVNQCFNNLKPDIVNNVNNDIKNNFDDNEVKITNGDVSVNNKSVNINNNSSVNVNNSANNKVKIFRKSIDLKSVSRSNSLKNQTNKVEETPVPKPRNDHLKRNSYCGDKFVEKIVKIEDNAVKTQNGKYFYIIL